MFGWSALRFRLSSCILLMFKIAPASPCSSHTHTHTGTHALCTTHTQVCMCPSTYVQYVYNVPFRVRKPLIFLTACRPSVSLSLDAGPLIKTNLEKYLTPVGMLCQRSGSDVSLFWSRAEAAVPTCLSVCLSVCPPIDSSLSPCLPQLRR